MIKYICIKSYRFLTYRVKIGEIVEIEKNPYDTYWVFSNNEVIDLITRK